MQASNGVCDEGRFGVKDKPSDDELMVGKDSRTSHTHTHTHPHTHTHTHTHTQSSWYTCMHVCL